MNGSVVFDESKMVEYEESLTGERYYHYGNIILPLHVPLIVTGMVQDGILSVANLEM